MKKTIVSTYCVCRSFGAILQSLGLQKALESIGIDSSVVVFDSDLSAKSRPVGLLGRVKKVARRILQMRFRSQPSFNYENSLRFIQKNVRYLQYKTPKQLVENCPDADVYIAGSDQIWHPDLCREDFFLSYVPKGKKKISYAASMGAIEVPEKNVEKFASLLQNIDTISVRERQMVPVLQKFTHKKIETHIDPTLLNSQETWRSYEASYDVKTPYVLVYAIYWDTAYNKALKELHDKYGYTIVSISVTKKPVYSNVDIYDAGPEHFLWLIDHAEAVVTSSFHGVAFSVVFNKQFSVVANPTTGSRVDNLLKTLDIRPAEIESVIEANAIDYEKVNQRVKEETNVSLEYLKREIDG